MPYNTIDAMPNYTKKYSMNIRRQAMHVFNSTYSKVFKETGSKQQAEKRAFMSMHSILKKRFKKKDSMEQNSRNDYFNMLVDSWLGNLKG